MSTCLGTVKTEFCTFVPDNNMKFRPKACHAQHWSQRKNTIHVLLYFIRSFQLPDSNPIRITYALRWIKYNKNGWLTFELKRAHSTAFASKLNANQVGGGRSFLLHSNRRRPYEDNVLPYHDCADTVSSNIHSKIYIQRMWDITYSTHTEKKIRYKRIMYHCSF